MLRRRSAKVRPGSSGSPGSRRSPGRGSPRNGAFSPFSGSSSRSSSPRQKSMKGKSTMKNRLPSVMGRKVRVVQGGREISYVPEDTAAMEKARSAAGSVDDLEQDIFSFQDATTEPSMLLVPSIRIPYTGGATERELKQLKRDYIAGQRKRFKVGPHVLTGEELDKRRAADATQRQKKLESVAQREWMGMGGRRRTRGRRTRRRRTRGRKKK